MVKCFSFGKKIIHYIYGAASAQRKTYVRYEIPVGLEQKKKQIADVILPETNQPSEKRKTVHANWP